MSKPLSSPTAFIAGDVLHEPIEWRHIDAALTAGVRAFEQLQTVQPERVAAFLETLARLIDEDAERLAGIAHGETCLPVVPRLRDVEIPRTTDQLRQAANAVRNRSWREPVISATAGVARIREPLPGVVFVLGPNNFPFAYNAIGGGDFGAAIGTGHPVLAKANPGHPQTSIELARLAMQAIASAGLPTASVQMIVDIPSRIGLAAVSDRRVAATAFTGSRSAGLELKAAADRAGRPIYLEMSAINPVVVLPGAASRRTTETAKEIAFSLTNGSGQFCTKPGLIFVPEHEWPSLRSALWRALSDQPVHPLLSERTKEELSASVGRMLAAGATVGIEIDDDAGPRCYPTTVLEVSAGTYLNNSPVFLQEAFGNATTVVLWTDAETLLECLHRIEGTLAAGVMMAESDVTLARSVTDVFRRIAGRIVCNKATTGVQVVPAMNHGGPYPATGHPGFTAVGIPDSFKRFTQLVAYDGFGDDMLPAELQTINPLGVARLVDD